MNRRRARTSILAALTAVASFAVTGCGPQSYNCSCVPNSADVAVPSAQTTSIDAVATDAPCWAMAGGPGSGIVTVGSDRAGTCLFRVALGNGDIYTFTVQFGASRGGCCGYHTFPVDASSPELVDAGVD